MKSIFLSIIFARSLFADWYNIALDCVEYDYQRPIVVCITSHNNKDQFKSCLDSVFSQNYSNYRVIYIDDASTDKTYNLLLEYVEINNLNERVIVLRNDEKEGELLNHYLMGNLCEEEEIIVPLDGKDRFMTNKALETINKAYMNQDVWVTYGQFMEIEDSIKPKALLKHKYHSNLLKKTSLIFKQPRTYYAWLFRHIPKECFAMEESGDIMIMSYLIELSRSHTYFIPDGY